MATTINEVKSDLDDMYDDLKKSREENRSRSEWSIEKSQKYGLDSSGIGAWGATENMEVDDPTRIAVRNKVFDTISKNLPVDEVSTLNTWDRLKINNLIDERPDLQEKYLRKKGYDTRIDQGTVVFKRPDEAQFRAIEPGGWDVLEVFDWVDEAADIAAETFALGVKGIGTMTGPTGMALGAAAAGTATAATEAAKQAIGIGAGVREEMDIGDIGKAFAEGAGGELTGRFVDTFTARPMRFLFGETQKPSIDADDLDEAEKLLDIKLPPGRKMAEGSVQRGREALLLKEGADFNKNLQHVVQQIDDVKSKFVSDFEAEAIRKKIDLAEGFREKLGKELDAKLEPIEKVYAALDHTFDKMVKEGDMDLDNELLFDLLVDVRDQAMQLETGAQNVGTVMDRIIADSMNVQTIKGDVQSVSELRTRVRRIKAATKDDPVLSDALDEAYDRITAFRSDQLKELAEEFPDELSGGVFGPTALDALQNADRNYASLQERFKAAFRTTKPEKKQNAQTILDTINELDPDKFLTKHGRNIERLEAMKKEYPETFKVIRAGIVGDIYQKAVKGTDLEPSAEDILGQLNKMDAAKRAVLFGADDRAKQDALIKVINAMDIKADKKAQFQLRRFLNTGSAMLNTLPLVPAATEMARANLYEFQLSWIAKKVAPLLEKTAERPLRTAVGTIGLQQAFSPTESQGIRRAIPQDPLSITPSLGGR